MFYTWLSHNLLFPISLPSQRSIHIPSYPYNVDLEYPEHFLQVNIDSGEVGVGVGNWSETT